LTPFSVELLANHDRSQFDCGIEELNRYLRQQANQDMKRKVAMCYVAIDRATGRLAGYYTLSPTSVLLTNLPPDLAKRFPRYPAIGAYLIGRLARDLRFGGLGPALLTEALFRVLDLPVAAFATIVYAKDDNAVQFYERHHFIRFPGEDRKLFISMAEVALAQTDAR
jgi:GNAT superfamily N-acetyltransferase